MMNVLLIGGGGREHALAWKLSQSPQLGTLFCAPGNAGIASLARCVDIDVAQPQAVIDFCRIQAVALVVVGPEAPLVDGLPAALDDDGITVFGPSADAARLEGSKGFTKDLCREAGIPTAAFGRFRDVGLAKAYLAAQSMPVVIKADGLAAGKGVVIAETIEAAQTAVDACFDGAFGEAGAEVVIEEFLVGEEASYFVLCDGEAVLPLATAQDHKRVGEGDTGPNTGGMGAYSPAPVMTQEMCQRVLDEIIMPTVRTMAARGTPFKGVLYAGLMLTEVGPKLIEYNVRFGDPECQVLMMRLRCDLLPVLIACAEGELGPRELSWCADTALTVVVATQGYPNSVQTGSHLRGLERMEQAAHTVVFHAGTKRDAHGRVVAAGGRVLGVTSRGANVAEAQGRAYAALGTLDWPEGFYRRDIGWRAAKRD